MKTRRLFLPLSVLLLASCGRPGDLPPEEVLRRAAEAGKQLQSANFTVDANVLSGTEDDLSEAVMHMEGVLQDGGQQLKSTIAVNGRFSDETASYDIEGSLEPVVSWEQELYVHLTELTIDPPHPLLNADALTLFRGKWWKLPDAETSGNLSRVTPDPSLLQAQSQVVTVVKDHGIETVNGREAYHYDVALDKEKLKLYLKKVTDERGEPLDLAELDALLASLQAVGALWVDAELFYVHTITWDIKKLPVDAAPPLSVKFTATLRDHNAAPPISPPEQFEIFSPFMFLKSTGGIEIVPPEFPDLTDAELDAIISGDDQEVPGTPLNPDDLPF